MVKEEYFEEVESIVKEKIDEESFIIYEASKTHKDDGIYNNIPINEILSEIHDRYHEKWGSDETWKSFAKTWEIKYTTPLDNEIVVHQVNWNAYIEIIK